MATKLGWVLTLSQELTLMKFYNISITWIYEVTNDHQTWQGGDLT